MPKKKQPRNAFFYFMMDYKARCERNGERFPNGLRDVQIEAGPEWDALPANEKKKYQDMAKDEKSKSKGEAVKVTCWHTPFKVVDDQIDEQERSKHEMNNYIENKIQSLSTVKLLAEQKFYLIHVNYFCISEGECHHPAELAISEFSIREGVTNVFNTIIEPGIPLGYRHEALQKAEKSHKIPIENNGGEKDFCKILSHVKSFLEPGRVANGGVYPPMYTVEDLIILNTSITAVKSVMKNLLDAGMVEENLFPIYSLEKLFLELRRAVRQLNDEEDLASIPEISVVKSELEKDIFNLQGNIACQFHYNEEAVENCSKSFVQRWAYMICDHCCLGLEIPVIQGKHIPLNADVNFQQRRLEEQEQKPTPKSRIDRSSKPPATTYSWVPREQDPLPRPQKTADLAAMLPPRNEFGFASEEDFPSIALGRGRGRVNQRGNGRGGNGTLSFAAATKK
uniref:HMG box domain-containing protein n=1 Tax=Graphocephala atropunctata TaxID=36148 RepID=A0A1B6KNM8_9HEMI